MTPQQHQRAKAIFLAARERPESQRRAFLHEACGDDAEIRAEVESLLAEDSASSSGFVAPIAVPSHAEPSGLGGSDERLIGRRIGHYRILDVLGVGGMGVVYRAEQDSPRREVALKIINRGIATPSTLRRFAHEAQVLGRLQHPGIAQIYEAGSFDSGAGLQPYFAMELVRGLPLTEYARCHALDMRRRLELIVKICPAVQHAHQKGVVHRDLKPGNILVNEVGEPKILDFGVARAIDSDVQSATLRTSTGQLIGTVPYMSPEQAAGDPHDIDTRSDVYALGLVLYELLTGRLPYDVSRVAPHEAARVIREEPPARPSTLDRTLRGDVETITLKALEKERQRRYRSAEALAEDIGRYLRNEPIQARRPSVAYHLTRFARRHRGLVAAAAVVLTLLVAGLTATSLLLVRAVQAEALAQEQKTRADREADAARAAQTLAQHNEARAVQEKERADAALKRVLSLADVKLVADYAAEAGELWPAHPQRIADLEAWLEKARALCERLPGHEAELAALRQRAIPRTAEEAAAERASHPRMTELETAQGRLSWLRRSLAVRQGQEVDPAPQPDWKELPADVKALNEIAWPLVDPDRKSFGDEARGLAMARRAAELAPHEAPILNTLAWALFANSLDAEAEEASRRALAAAAEADRHQYQSSLEKLQQAIAEVTRPGGLERLRQKVAQAEAQVNELEEKVSARRSWHFADTAVQWQHQMLAELVERLRAFGTPGTGTVADVEKRLQFALTIEERSVSGPEAKAAWAAAIEAISDCPLYGGLKIKPQIGLLPLGRNPQTGLWEFWHIQTGARPQANPSWPEGAVNRWIITEGTALVFVLIPGGTFRRGAERPGLGVKTRETPEGLAVTSVSAGTLAERMGLQQGDLLRAVDGAAIKDSAALARALRQVRSGAAVTATVLRGGAELELTATAEGGIDSPNVDPDASDDESPVHDVTLDPFFLSKYEMTQGQWLRFVGENPSYFAPGESSGDVVLTAVHPVEQVSWDDADRALRKLSLLLPTESQWEYACRAGTGSVWHTGGEPGTLRGYANIADEGSARAYHAGWSFEKGFKDGFVAHAPVGSFMPNPFGLHDMHGNVSEWCRDLYTGGYANLARAGDGLRDYPPDELARIYRGGSFLTPAVAARSAVRWFSPADHLSRLGLRPSRVITE